LLPSAPRAPDEFPRPDLIAAIPRLRRYARVLTGNPARADDLVQDTLTRAWTKRSLWRAGSDLRAWLFAIMHNVHANQCALARREARNISLDSEDHDGEVWRIGRYGNELHRIELTELMEFVSRLAAEQREVLLLAAVEELPYKEIAEMLAIPIGTVMSRLSRARENLRSMAGKTRRLRDDSTARAALDARQATSRPRRAVFVAE
jgi:RNA polymerase sigma-70 factor (ECF subfamily)